MSAANNVVKAKYTGPTSKGKSAKSLANYIGSRRDDEGGLYDATTFGDRQGFVAAAQQRAEEGRQSSYTHVVISPANGDQFSDHDFEKLLKSATTSRSGEEQEYFAAVHRDGNRAHMHIAVAREKYGNKELDDLKKAVNERIGERDNLRRLERDDGRENEGRGRSERTENESRTQGPEQGRYDIYKPITSPPRDRAEVKYGHELKHGMTDTERRNYRGAKMEDRILDEADRKERKMARMEREARMMADRADKEKEEERRELQKKWEGKPYDNELLKGRE